MRIRARFPGSLGRGDLILDRLALPTAGHNSNYETLKLADFCSFCSPLSFSMMTSILYLPAGQPLGGGVNEKVALPLLSKSKVFSRLGTGPGFSPGTSSTTKRPFTWVLLGAFETVATA